MKQPPVIIVGAGGHACVVADALLACGRQVLGFLDAGAGGEPAVLMGLRVLGNDEALREQNPEAIELANGIGGAGDPALAVQGSLRRRVQERLEAQGFRFTSVRHPASVVSPHASLSEGSQVLAGAVVQPAALIGRGAIVNTRAVVEHHCQVGDFAHIAPGAVLCGDVVVGQDSHVGAGATVRNGLHLGARIVVGMGAVVTRPVDAGVVVGVPARAMGGRS